MNKFAGSSSSSSSKVGGLLCNDINHQARLTKTISHYQQQQPTSRGLAHEFVRTSIRISLIAAADMHHHPPFADCLYIASICKSLRSQWLHKSYDNCIRSLGCLRIFQWCTDYHHRTVYTKGHFTG